MKLNEWYKLQRSSVVRKQLMESFKTTAGLCGVHAQANVAIIPSQFVDDFKNFCMSNPGPCPLISQQKLNINLKIRETDHVFNVRTDVLQYIKWANGSTETDLDNLRENLDDFVSFALGCSFTFDDELLNAGIPCNHVLQRRVIPMYETSVLMKSVGPFGGKMFVSMRPIRKEHLHQVIQISFSLPKCHGLPIQIGSPFMMGIHDLNSPIAGDITHFDYETEIPVFWSCELSSQIAIKEAKLAVCFSLAPMKMAVLENLTEDFIYENKSLQPSFFVLRQDPYFGSILSTRALKVIQQIENLVSQDPGNRGIKDCVQFGNLTRSALALSHSQNVAILTGFPVPTSGESSYEYENDGITGSLVLGETLQKIGKNVEIFIDDFFFGQYLKLWEELGFSEKINPLSDLCVCQFDHVIAIERPGRSRSTGKYHFMSGKEISEPFNLNLSQSAFEDARQSKTCFTTSIADGGNELGSGFVHQLVEKFVQNGDKISVDSAADFLILAGTSNWAAFALAQAMNVLQCCGVHQYYKKKGIGIDYTSFEPKSDILKRDHSADREREILELLGKNGIVDGISKFDLLLFIYAHIIMEENHPLTSRVFLRILADCTILTTLSLNFFATKL